MQAVKGFFFFFFNTSLPVCNLNRCPGPKGCKGTWVQTHCLPPARCFSLGFTPLGSCSTTRLPAGEEKAMQWCTLPGYIPRTHFVSWGPRRRMGATCLWLGFSVGGQQRNSPHQVVISKVQICMEHLLAGGSHGLWGLVGQPGLCKVFLLQTRQVPVCVEATGAWSMSGYRYTIW